MVLQKRLAWALFVLLLSTLVCCQPTELIWACLFQEFFNFTPPPSPAGRSALDFDDWPVTISPLAYTDLICSWAVGGGAYLPAGGCVLYFLEGTQKVCAQSCKANDWVS